VKSANILLDKHFEPKLGDFGLSRDGQVDVEGGESRPMIASHVKGTLAYLPPEFITRFGQMHFLTCINNF
jgi:interleukin-1 receptor-associated kinase 1